MSAGIPETMTAIAIPEPGGPEVLTPTRRPTPRPADGEVLIRVAAAGLNGADLSQRKGRYAMPPGVTDIPGLECSGEVVAVGGGVRGWRPGDRVCALLSGGGYAEYATAPAPQCMPIPPGVSPIDAGGLPETYCTVWTNVFDRCRLRPGETFLVQGGASGIGTTAIQLARAFGSPTLATAGSEEKCAACRDFGADRAINYRTEDFLEVGREFTGGRGVDVILDMVGGDYIPRELELLAMEGRLCFINLMAGKVVEANFGLIHARHLTVTGSRLRPRSVEAKGAICAALVEEAWPLFGEGRCRPATFRTYPLTEAAEAHRLMEARGHIGKILLVPEA